MNASHSKSDVKHTEVTAKQNTPQKPIIKLSPSKLIYRMGDILQIEANTAVKYHTSPRLRVIDEQSFKLTTTGDVEIKACLKTHSDVCQSITIKISDRITP